MDTSGQLPSEQRGRGDWTGLIVAACLSPVFFAFVYLGKPELGFTVAIVLGMATIAIKSRWKLSRYSWFWATIALVAAIHIPFLFLVHWPTTNVPTIAYSMPFGVADFLLISGAISLAEKLFSKNNVSDDEGS